MSLIFGINLSDRIWLAADTRLSYFSRDAYDPDQPDSFTDDLLKIEALTGDVIVAAAGSLKLAKFLITKLKKEDFVKQGINATKNQIVDWVANSVDEYLKKGNSYTSVCLLFGGVDKTKKKVISGQRLLGLVKDFQDLRKVEIGMNGPLFKAISAKPGVPNPFPELPVPDSNLFAVLSNAKRGILELHETEWGDFLAYGPKGFNKDKLPKETFGRFEFEKGSGVGGSDPTILTALIYQAAEDNHFATVGGSIVPIFVDGRGVWVSSSKVHRMNLRTTEVEIISNTKQEGDKIYYFSNEMKKYLPLVPITEYRDNQNKSPQSLI